jgi:hypothetical protein
VTSPAGALKAAALLAAIVAALVLLRRGSNRVGAIHEVVNATHELVTDCYHDLRAMRVNHDGDRATTVRGAAR